jgi:hypothetical protein
VALASGTGETELGTARTEDRLPRCEMDRQPPALGRLDSQLCAGAGAVCLAYAHSGQVSNAAESGAFAESVRKSVGGGPHQAFRYAERPVRQKPSSHSTALADGETDPVRQI